MKRRDFAGWMLAAPLVTAATKASATTGDYPNRPITIIIPAAAGGGLDMVARAMAEEMGRSMKQTVIVENRPGAAGVIATNAVAKAPGDGYTVTLTLTQAILNNLFLFNKVPYDTRRDLAFVSEICTAQLVMLVDARLPVNSPQELLAWLAKHPDRANYGSWGPGSYPHIAGFHLGRSRNVSMVHVPYKGEAPMVQDLLGGQLTWTMASLASARPHIESGRVRALAVTGDKRVEGMPGVPTFAQAGLGDKELIATGAVTMMAPIATPPDVLQRLEKESLAALSSTSVRARMQEVSFIPLGNGSTKARANYDAMYPVQQKLFKDLGIKLD